MSALFKEVTNESAYLKCGIYGESKSGKTWTASILAIGLHKYINSKEPVFFLDSEGGVDFVLPLFKKEKIKLMAKKTRTFVDLLAGAEEAEQHHSVLLIDSITHFWDELMESYRKKHDLERITLKHWMPIKATWKAFTEKFVNSKLHIIMAGRAGYIWEMVSDEEGIEELQQTGTKLRAEVNTAYEPNLLIEMVRVRKTSKPGAPMIHRAFVVGDRSDVLDGKVFDNPTFESFLPHIEILNLGGKYKGIDLSRDSQGIFAEKSNVGIARIKLREKLLEKIQNEIYLLYPGRDEDSKKSRLLMLEQVFGTNAWKELEEMRNEVLQKGYERVNETRRQKSAPTIEPGTNEAKS